MAKKRKKRYYRKRRKNTYIYVITAGKYYYVGKSNRPWIRLEAHKRKAINNEGKNRRKNKVIKRHLHNLKMRILEKPKMKDWRKRERYWIKYYRNKYGKAWVLNATSGGDGHSGYGYDIGKKKGSDLTNTIVSLIVVLGLCGIFYLMV